MENIITLKVAPQWRNIVTKVASPWRSIITFKVAPQWRSIITLKVASQWRNIVTLKVASQWRNIVTLKVASRWRSIVTCIESGYSIDRNSNVEVPPAYSSIILVTLKVALCIARYLSADHTTMPELWKYW